MRYAATEMAPPFAVFTPKAVMTVMTMVHLMTHLRLIMTFETLIWKPPSHYRLLKPHLQDPRLPLLPQLQLLRRLPLLQPARLMNLDVSQTELCLVVLTNSMAWDPESSHVLAHGTISRQHVFITQTWSLSQTRRTPREPPGRRGVLPRRRALWCLRRTGEGRKRLQPVKE